jgi:hypothetical protein
MSKRLDAPSTSSVYLHFRVTPEEESRIKGLAHYLGMAYGAMLRQLAEEKRQALYDEGKRPPVRPPVADGVLQDSGVPTPRKKR